MPEKKRKRLRDFVTEAKAGKDYSAGQRVYSNIKQAPGDDFVRVRSIRSLNQEKKVCTVFDVRDPIILEIEYQVLKEVQICAQFVLSDELGRLILVTKDNLDSPWRDTVTPGGVYRARCYLPGDFLNNGHIAVSCAIITGHHGVHAQAFNALVLTIEDRLDPGWC